MNNLKNMLSKSVDLMENDTISNSQPDDTLDNLSIDEFFSDVMIAAAEKASENYSQANPINYEIDMDTFRSGASFALKWFSEKIRNA